MTVPKCIHQIWMQGKDAVPDKYSAARATWPALHPTWEIKVWDEEDLAALVAGTRWEVAIRLCRRLIQRADVYRCAVLETFGGVYIDMDMYALEPLDSLLQEERIQVGLTTFQGVPFIKYAMSVNNGVILCPPKSPFWQNEFLPVLIRQLQTNTIIDDLSPAFNTIRTTGPGVWSKFLHSPSLLAHPVHYFYTLGIGKQQTSQALTDEQRKRMKGSFIYHMQDSAWLDSWEYYLVKSLIHKNWIITVSVLLACIVLFVVFRLRIFRVARKRL